MFYTLSYRQKLYRNAIWRDCPEQNFCKYVHGLKPAYFGIVSQELGSLKKIWSEAFVQKSQKCNPSTLKVAYSDVSS